ncbi:lysoplasmalogenase [Aquibium oceanicum]|nr:lysoplasmalogenase [Aquibium oceanicum]
MMPFPGGPEALPNGTLLLSVVAAVLYLFMTGREPSWRRTLAKTASTALLAVLAFLVGGPVLLVVALALSAAGDAFLAHEGEPAFMAGLGSFLAAHLAYIVLFAQSGAGLAALAAEPWRLAAALLMLAFSVVMFRQLRPVLPPGLLAPVAVYVAAILGMGVFALTLPSWVVIAGAVLFMASDAILAAGRFLIAETSPRQAIVRPAVWILYYLAQVAITLGFLLG